MSSDRRLTELVTETRAAAANPEHPWDKQALEWPLNQDSVVVDVGGYKGRWALQITERYHPRLYVFEPQPWAADVCRAVLGEQATVEGYGLGVDDDELPMGKWGTDGCSFVGDAWGDARGDARMREIDMAFRDLDITHIDLMMMNIEGYEYTLIPYMLDKNILPDRLMVQFHTFADPDGTKQAGVFDRLAELGYTIPWSYGNQLTAWARAAQPATQSAPRKRGGRRAS